MGGPVEGSKIQRAGRDRFKDVRCAAGSALVEIVAFPGRSVAAKRTLYQSLARRFEAAGVSPKDLFVIITEPPLENWSPRNGESSADVKPAFKLDV